MACRECKAFWTVPVDKVESVAGKLEALAGKKATELELQDVKLAGPSASESSITMSRSKPADADTFSGRHTLCCCLQPTAVRHHTTPQRRACSCRDSACQLSTALRLALWSSASRAQGVAGRCEAHA